MSATAPSRLERADRQKVLLALAAGVLLTLLLVDLGGRELWTDEVYSLAAGTQPLEVSLCDASHPPAYVYLLHYWLQLAPGAQASAGPSDGWLRGFSVIFALLAWVLTWLLAGELNLRREGLVAAWFMALSPLLLLYFRLGRYYSLATAATMLCLYLLARLARRPGWWGAAVPLALAVAAVAYVDYIALAVVLLALLVVGLALALRRDGETFWPLAAATVGGLLLAVPVFLRLLRDTGKVAAITADPLAKSGWGFVLKCAFPVYGLATGECVDPWRWWVSLPAVGLVVVLLVVGILSLWRRGPLPRLVAVLFPVNVLVAALSLSTVAANVPPNRVMSLAMCTAPLAYLVMARGALRLRGAWTTVLALALLGAIYGYGLTNYVTRQQLLNPGYAPPWRQVAAVIQPREQPAGDVIWMYDDGFDRYYQGRLSVAKPAEMDAQLAQLAAGRPIPPRRIWLIARDRGAAALLDQTEQARQTLLAHGYAEQVFPVMPRTPRDQRMRTLVLRRPAWDAYVKVYLLERRELGSGNGKP